MNFGENLKKLRKSKKISQEELAEKVGVSRQSVSKWETSESYPEMNNILELCKIFHCHINDLVNDNIIDIDSLDEEIKMSAVKFKREKQAKMKRLSKAIEIISKIGKIVTTICIPIVILVGIVIPFIINDVKITDDKISFKGNTFVIKEEKNNISINFNNTKIADESDPEIINKVRDVFDNQTSTVITIITEFALIILIVYLVLIRLVFKYLENLFKNIHENDTPFTLENVRFIKKIAWYLIVAIVLPSVSGNIGIELFNLIEILFLFSIAYIFEYGYEIQLDTKGRMYGDENE